MTKERWTFKGRTFLVYPGLIAVALSACSGGSGSASPTPASTNAPTTLAATTTTSPKITATSKPTVEEVVQQRWLAYWDVFAAATQDPNPSDPKLADYMIGPAFSGLQGVLKARVKDGIVVRYTHGASTHRPRVASVNAKGATVRDCWEDRAVQVNKASGAVVNDRISTYLVEGEMVLDAGVWKTFSYRLVQTWHSNLKDSGCVA